jgi:hypothetical protein
MNNFLKTRILFTHPEKCEQNREIKDFVHSVNNFLENRVLFVHPIFCEQNPENKDFVCSP